ncbi:hypothetical protein Forpe1208_v008706 [Fusarium oxysporum f. sp. rapae]|uniref:Stress-response A/B barrel domain-containing protein n=1 Tax=Fusarium oxysporum f. sp. rapae TaxID=485398 RepID=A0A8J5U7W9_FUSOX|nr:hypothetical protein Forpe1208_v008706 [Fusarium oxysporum f. sp. rapae]
MADLSNVLRYKIFNNKKEAIEIPASQVLKYPAFEEHFTRTSRSRTRRLDSGRCSCIIDIVTVFLRNGRFYKLHTGQCRCICKSTNFCTRAVAIYDFAIEFELHALAGLVTDDMPKFAEHIKPTDVLCLKLMYGESVTPEAAGMSSHPQLSNHESLRQDLARLVMSLADEPDSTCDDFLQLKNLCIHPTSNKPYITSLQGGKDNSPEGMQNGITHGFVATFESAEDRDYYVKTDPAHQAFIANVGGLLEKAIVVDFTNGVY